MMLQVGLKTLTARELLNKNAHFVAVTELYDTVAHHMVPPVLKPTQLRVPGELKIHEGAEFVLNPVLFMDLEEVPNQIHQLQASDLCWRGRLLKLIAPFKQEGSKFFVRKKKTMS